MNHRSFHISKSPHHLTALCASLTILTYGIVAWTAYTTFLRKPEPVCNRCSCMVSTAHTFAGQIALYRRDHNNHLPSLEHFYDQLLNPTNLAGETTNGLPSPDFPFGPYIQARPVNAANQETAVGSAPSPSVGWVYVIKGNSFMLYPVNDTGDGMYTHPGHEPYQFQ